MKEIDAAFSRVFSTQDGQVVLAVLLEEMHFLDRADTEEFQALNNYAKTLIARCGFSSTYRLIESLNKTNKE